MSSDYIMTMQQAQMEMELYKKVFTVVRLLDKREFRLEENDNPGGDMELCHCYDFWKKEKPCKNCIAARAFEEKSVRTKLEYLDSDIYQVTARYVEIDGQPYVMELLRKMDEEFLVDLENRDRLMEKLSGYNEKLYQDALTGVYNRRYYEDRIKQMTASVGVAMIDMDDFKIYNDTYGHNAGDLALITTVEAIRRCIRKNDTLIRYGGDEFLLVLQGISETMFREKLKQIRTEIYNANVPTYSRLQLSASIGGVMSAGRTVEETVMEADKFMYLAKNRKNTVVTEKDFANEEGEDGTALEALKVKQQILIVDDSEMNREILTEMLQDDFRILEAENGEEALKMLKQYGTGISLMLLDIVMPVMNGFEVLAAMAREHWMDDIPVIMISSEGSEDYIRRAYEMGIADYIRRPFDAKIVYQRVFNTIKLYAKQRRLISLVADQIYEKEKNNRMMVGILSQIVEFRNGESGPHVLHIQTLTRLLLERLVQKTGQYGLSWSEQYMISMASALHDIGKIGIDEKILNKPGKLTKEEFDPKQHFTQPPAHYTEASLVKTMEELGIGRPSTYAPTISLILGRRYITKEGKNLYLTEIGEVVNNIMKQSFPSIVDVHFTANMEGLLDMVEEGKVPWKEVIRNFYPDLEEAVEIAEKELEEVKIEDEVTDVICEECGRNMVIKYGPHGKFLACPGFPECRNTKPYLEKIGVPCPVCGKEVVIRKTKKGRKYYGCEDNPECEFMSWQKPSSKKCPECGGYMVEKGNKLVCADEKCGYVETIKKED